MMFSLDIGFGKLGIDGGESRSLDFKQRGERNTFLGSDPKISMPSNQQKQKLSKSNKNADKKNIFQKYWFAQKFCQVGFLFTSIRLNVFRYGQCNNPGINYIYCLVFLIKHY